jgi:hypothetical protein
MPFDNTHDRVEKFYTVPKLFLEANNKAYKIFHAELSSSLILKTTRFYSIKRSE